MRYNNYTCAARGAAAMECALPAMNEAEGHAEIAREGCSFSVIHPNRTASKQIPMARLFLALLAHHLCNGLALTSNYIRLERTQSAMELQTASVVLSMIDEATGKPFELGLLSTVHLAELPYYESLQRDADSGYDRVLFELLVDEAFVDTDAAGLRRLKDDLQPAPALAALAARNRLTTQVGALNCRRDDRWVLADVSRAELQAKEADAGFGAPFADAPARSKLIAPLRSIFSSGPPTDAAGGQFQPNPLRLLLTLLPAPEAALLLDDWVASRGATPAPILVALGSALSRLDWGVASRLSFAQTLASGEATQSGTLAGALVRWRNSRALDEVERALGSGCERIALLYGALHMRDLRAKLQARYRLVEVSEPRWETAWSISLPLDEAMLSMEGSKEGAAPAALGASGAGSMPALAMLRAVAAPAAVLIGLLAVDASDWLGLLGDLIHALPSDALAQRLTLDTGGSWVAASDGAEPLSAGAALLACGLYFGRHAVLYLALQRWTFQWDSRWWAAESGEP